MRPGGLAAEESGRDRDRRSTEAVELVGPDAKASRVFGPELGGLTLPPCGELTQEAAEDEKRLLTTF